MNMDAGRWQMGWTDINSRGGKCLVDVRGQRSDWLATVAKQWTSSSGNQLLVLPRLLQTLDYAKLSGLQRF